MIIVALTIANLKMIFRNRQSLFWALAFPLIFVTVFGLFFERGTSSTTIAVIDYSKDLTSAKLIENLDSLDNITIQNEPDETVARRNLANGDFSYLLILPETLDRRMRSDPPATLTMLYDASNPYVAMIVTTINRFVAGINLELTNVADPLELEIEGIYAPQLEYFDFLLPGLVAMAIMNFSIIGVATLITSYRENKILKRILATPLETRSFFISLILAYLVISLIQTAAILTAGTSLFGAELAGNYLYLTLLVILGNLLFLNIGFIVGSFSRTTAAASGLGNAVTLPMMFLSGVFFPKESLPSIMQSIVSYLPLSPLVDALRGVALDSNPIWVHYQDLGVIGLWLIATAIASVKFFKFE